MYGALIGDIVGSAFEGKEGKDNLIPFEIFTCPQGNRFTDDSVLTAAVSAWLLDGEKDLPLKLLRYAQRYLDRGYGPSFLMWAVNEYPVPAYHSFGNGAAMRVSPVALHATTFEEAERLGQLSAQPTHNHPQGLAGARHAAYAIRHALEYQDPLRLKQETLEPSWAPERHVFVVECEQTVQMAIWCATEASSFEETLARVLWLGGDTDTLGAIAGAIAEGLYGIEDRWLNGLRPYFEKPGGELLDRVNDLYAYPLNRARLEAWGRLPSLTP